MKKATKRQTKKIEPKAYSLFGSESKSEESATAEDGMIHLNLKLSNYEIYEALEGRTLKRVFTRRNAERLHRWLTKELTKRPAVTSTPKPSKKLSEDQLTAMSLVDKAYWLGRSYGIKTKGRP
jgi:hypothetical protein